jgi:hypothetical protein
MKLSIVERDHLNALSLYLATRRTALRSALRFRAPLSTEASEDLRIHYSNYFVSLFSAVDLLAENKSMAGGDFKDALETAFETVGASRAVTNCAYVRELRNAVVHRGLDIASAAHFAGDFPLLIAPNPAMNRGGTQKYPAFGFYLLEIVAGCEAVVGPTIETHLDSLGILDKRPDSEAWLDETREVIRSSTVIPDWAKKMVPASFDGLDWNAMHRDSVAKLRDLLQPLDFVPRPPAHSDGAV